MKIINPTTVMPPQGGYSQGIQAANLVFVAGQVGVDAQGKLTGDAAMAEQTRQTIANVAAVLAESGARLTDVVSATVYVKSFAEYKVFDQVWQECFGEHKPARATVQAELVLPQLLVEIQAIAVIAQSA
ncbi:Enamine/imine deaminase [compost metagenome]|uniref:Endoribonuclease L-PSP n=2 Tax=Pseudomonas TaxID=286 RepID=A0A1H4QP12_PSEJE|nr:MULTISPECIES: RidA family protein [Pseudomonas]SEC21380.1 endoribonuclease L-PSP [Pseudomonas jessenii]VVP70188.1 2-iminobutanoate/2-iminopropanoate deaminase [Pseudomonas fluorescens]